MGRMETICRELGCEASEVFGMVLELVAATEELRAARVRAEQEVRAARAESWELVRAHLAGEAVDMEFMEAAREFWLDDPWSVNKVLGVEVVKADNPYGCNQYGEGWKEEHNGNSTKYEQTGFSGKVSKMLINKQDGNTVEVATKDKKPGKGAYPDASNKGLEEAAVNAEIAKEKKLLKGLEAFGGLLNGVKKTLEQYESKDGLFTVKALNDTASWLKGKIEAAKTNEEKKKWLGQVNEFLENGGKLLNEELDKAMAKEKANKGSSVQMQHDFTAKKAEALEGLKAGIGKVEAALAAAIKQGNGFAEIHFKHVVAGLKHWQEAIAKNNEVSKQNFEKLKAHSAFVAKLLSKAESDIKTLQSDHKTTVQAEPKKQEDKPASAKYANKGIKKALIDMPAQSGNAIFKLIQEVETAGDKAAAKVWSKLSEAEKKAVYKYSGGGYVDINKSFREGKPTPTAKTLAKALNKMELGMNVRVTRCEGRYGLEGVLPKTINLQTPSGLEEAAYYLNKKAEEGDWVIRPNKAPMSTSLAKGAFGYRKVVRVIDLPKGTKGGCIANYAQFKGEREFLIAPGTKTRIIGAEVDNNYIFIREEVVL